MTNIKVDPDNLRNISKRLKELSGTMVELANDASSAGNSAPSYEGQFRSRVFPLGSNANSNLTRMVANLEDYAISLEKTAARFEQADNSYSGSLSWSKLLRILREGGLKGFFDALDKQRLLEMTGLLGLGALFLPPMPWNPTPVYGSDGSTISQNLRGIQVIIGKIGNWFKRMWGNLFSKHAVVETTPKEPDQKPDSSSTIPPKPNNLPQDSPTEPDHQKPRYPSPPTSPTLNVATPEKSGSCAEYARSRRPDLGHTSDGKKEFTDDAAANYKSKFSDTAFRLEPADSDYTSIIGKGYALVWEPGIPNPTEINPTYGHVAIVEEVGPDYVVVSHSGWGPGTTTRFTFQQLQHVWVIP